MSIFCYDLDGTICATVAGDYEHAHPLTHMVNRVNQQYAEGHRIILHTARGTVTRKDWKALTEQQLTEWGVQYHELHFGKPYADCYVDDRAMLPTGHTDIAAIIQARMDSTRLPGKVLMDIGGKPLLQHVVDVAHEAVGDVFLVFPTFDLELAVFAEDNDIPYSFDRRGRDLLDSYYHCAERYGIQHIVRITADNPLIDPQMVKKLLRFYQEGGFDWAANCRLKVTYPVGNDAEVFSFKALGRAWAAKTTDYEREHVTPYIYHHSELFKLGVMENDKDESDQRWTVDTPEDLERVREIYARRQLCLTRG